MNWYYITVAVLLCVSVIGFVYNWRRLEGSGPIEIPAGYEDRE